MTTINMGRPNHSSWRLYLVRGVFAIFFGLAILLLPGFAFATILIFFAMFMIADGFFSLFSSLTSKREINNKGWMIFIGITGIVVGILALFQIFVAAITLIFLFAFWSFFAGIMEMIRAVNFRKDKRKETWYVLSGLLCMVIIILLLINPVSGVLSFAGIFSIYALGIGISLIVLSARTRNKYMGSRHKSRYKHI